MREIKFRAWNYDRKEMLSDIADGMMIQMNNGQLGWYNTEGDFNECDYILMQFTGLKDKNGKEIYEGDVVRLTAEGTYYNSPDKYEECNVDKTYIGEVVIIASKGACLKRPSYTDNITGDKDKSDQYINVVQYRSEVIGNIYENPDLLK